VFKDNDIGHRDVKISDEFWKVSVVVKDDGEISATAYIVPQKRLLNNLEISVPGEFKTFQVKVSLVEALTGLDFFNLRNQDPLERIESIAVGKFSILHIKFSVQTHFTNILFLTVHKSGSFVTPPIFLNSRCIAS